MEFLRFDEHILLDDYHALNDMLPVKQNMDLNLILPFCYILHIDVYKYSVDIPTDDPTSITEFGRLDFVSSM